MRGWKYLFMGLDTVELKGVPFNVFVKEGYLVTPETLIAEMDLPEIEQAGKKTDIIVALTNNEKLQDFLLTNQDLFARAKQSVKLK